jgi:uncharacterized zinc-type alcohol dehydrogenase-like protein
MYTGLSGLASPFTFQLSSLSATQLSFPDEINECTQSGRQQPMAWIVEAVAAKRQNPVQQNWNKQAQFDVKPTHKVGVIGIGGLGHLALQFLNKRGCEVTAFSSSASKAEEAQSLGAHHFVDSRDSERMQALAGQFNFILNTTNVSLDWPAYLNALAPRGRLHTVGVVPEPIGVPGILMNMGQRSLSGSPVGSPATVDDMLQFCARHEIAPLTEQFPISQVNEALDHLRSGTARYRVVVKKV